MDTVIAGPLGEWLADRIPKLAGIAHRRFQTVPTEDFEQEMWLRALKRKLKLAQYLREGNEAYIWRELNAAATRLGKEDDRYRRACKAARAGYRPLDEEFYSAGTLGLLLEALIDTEFDAAEAAYSASCKVNRAGVFIPSSGPDAGSDLMVMMIDVATTYRRLRKGEQKTLKDWFSCEAEDTERGRWDRQGLASSMGMTYDAFRLRKDRALRKLQRELGGEDPWRKQDREAA